MVDLTWPRLSRQRGPPAGMSTLPVEANSVRSGSISVSLSLAGGGSTAGRDPLNPGGVQVSYTLQVQRGSCRRCRYCEEGDPGHVPAPLCGRCSPSLCSASEVTE